MRIRREIGLMFLILFFIIPFVFFVLAVIFSFCITDKIPEWLAVNIGKLNADDIRNMDNKERMHLRKQVIIRFTAAIIAALAISFAFIILGDINNGLLAIPCNFISLIAGVPIIMTIIKEANKLKQPFL